MEHLEFPRFFIDTLFAFEERIQEISQGSLFKGTVVDFDNFDLRDGGESCGYRKINRRVGGNG
ncbi:MAG: hypothetical protein HXS48_12755 [Theionarchaea archaeon]|nr:MAG: hypothetical protein AYK19_19705 [Theionarchaea archaeon DG-70-1]MBU7027799.1 hypothetical protein [Theionarchaea archaeon]